MSESFGHSGALGYLIGLCPFSLTSPSAGAWLDGMLAATLFLDSERESGLEADWVRSDANGQRIPEYAAYLLGRSMAR